MENENNNQSAGQSMGNSSTGEAGTAHQNVDVNQGQSGTASAQESGTQGQSNDSGDWKIEDLPQGAQDLIKSLRSESADHRTKNNNLTTRLENIENGFKTMFGGEDGQEQLTPEQQIEQLQGGYESLSYENAVMGLAYENGIPMDNYEYFNFLMDKAVNSLDEGQELSEEALLEVIQKSKGFNATMDNTNTSVDGNSGNNNPEGQQGAITLEAFTGMSVVEKSELYRKNPAVYNQLMSQARDKRLL
jgi:hypothetical protein